MTTFDEREQAYEAKLAHDEELRFKATARRNKLLGLWAAQKMGKSGDAAEEYAAALVTTGLVGVGGDLIFKKLRADFDAAHLAVSDQELHQQMETLSAKATDEIMGGASKLE
ncbi:MAG TPA: DUF1476 domain-containing protein [Methylovirgula sp.]|jgi:hypothetical protein